MSNNNFEPGDESFIGSPYIPNIDKTDGIRGAMGAGAALQSLVLASGCSERPRVYTGFEQQCADYSRMIYKVKSDLKVVSIHESELHGKTLFCSTIDNTVIEIPIPRAINFTENYGALINFYGDHFRRGDIIPKDFILYSSTAYDSIGNYGMGTNLFSCLTSIKDGTYEDATIISVSGAKKLSHNYVYEIPVIFNRNDIPITRLPEIGDTIDEFLYVLRKISYDDLRSVKDNALTPKSSDSYKELAGGVVQDIKVFSNVKSDDEMLQYPYMAQVKSWVEKSNSDKAALLQIYQQLEDNEIKVHDDIRYRFGMLSMDTPYRSDNVFDGVMVVFTVSKEVSAVVGTKVTGRYGNKGVISRILPDNQMPMVNGRYLEMISNPLAIGNRLIPSVLFEVELDYLRTEIWNMIDVTPNLSNHDRVALLVKYFYRRVSNEQSNVILAQIQLNTVSEEDWISCKDMEIHQAPFWDNSDFDKVKEIYAILEENYPTLYGREYSLPLVSHACPEIDFLPSAFQAVVGDQYILKLKHEPSTKFSARNTGVTDLKSLPSRVKGVGKFNSNPVRFGEQEFLNALMFSDRNTRTVQDLLSWIRRSSSSKNMRITRILSQLGRSDSNIGIDDSISTLTILNTYLNALGYKLVHTQTKDDNSQEIIDILE